MVSDELVLLLKNGCQLCGDQRVSLDEILRFLFWFGRQKATVGLKAIQWSGLTVFEKGRSGNKCMLSSGLKEKELQQGGEER